MVPPVSDDFSEGKPISCLVCQMDTVADAAFCNHCGERLPARCRACDTLNSPGRAFCYSCGSPIADAEPRTRAYKQAPPVSVVCRRCSKISDPGAAYCYSCGLPLDDEPTPCASVPPPTYTRYDSRHAWRGDDCEYAVGEPAGFWIRLAAYWIDGLVTTTMGFAIMFVLGVVAYMAGYEFGNDDGVGMFRLLFFIPSILFYFLYYAIGWSRWGTTVGKRSFDLYVVRTDGSKVGFLRALARSLAYLVSSLYYIGFLMIAFRRDKRGLHDLICGTVVVRRR